MNKPKRDHAVQEAPTEWRKILLEEGPNGEMIPVGLEPMTPNGSVPQRSPQPVTSPSSADLPDEWQSVFEEASTPQTSRTVGNNISLQQELPEFSENTIPGMQLPDILKKEMQDPDSSERVSSHIRNAPQVQEILNKNNSQKIPPPKQDLHLHDNTLFGPDPGERTIANHRLTPPKKPMVVPTPQINEEDPAPNAIPAQLAEKLGRAPVVAANEPQYTPSDLDAYAGNDALHDPPTFDSHAEVRALHQPPEQSYDDTNDSYDEHLRYETDDLQDEKTSYIDQDLQQIRELHQAQPVEEELEQDQATSNEHTAALPILPTSSPTPPPSSFDHETLRALQQSAQQQQEQLQELLVIAKEQRDLAKEQQEENNELRRSLERVRTELDTDREETRFQALYGIFQDLLLLFDYVDLRYRSLWDSHGEHHPAVHEASAFRKRLLDILTEQGLHPIDVTSYEFDPTAHRALQEVPTPHHSEDQQISRIFRQGFRFHEKVFRPTEVEIKRYAP